MIVLDIEASGTEYEKHSIVSIGAFDFRNPANRFYEECRIWEVKDVPGSSLEDFTAVCEQCGAKCSKGAQPQLRAHIMEGALEVNGFTEAEITDPNKQTEAEITKMFLDWSKSCVDRTICGQNPSFDRDFVRHAAARAGLDYNLAYRTVDTHSLCWMHIIKRGNPPPVDPEHKRSNLNLDAILEYCGIPEEPHPHNALTGALCHGEVASRLLYDKKLLPEFEKYEIPWLT